MKAINIKDLEHYMIDVDGTVYNTRSTKGRLLKNEKRKLKSFPNKRCLYLQIILQNKKAGLKPKLYYIHRLVAYTFIPNPDNLKQVNHKNFNRQDNKIENLEWVSNIQNIKHYVNSDKFKHRKRSNVDKFKYKIIQKDEELLKAGILLYNNFYNITRTAELWDCSENTVRKIFKIYNICKPTYKIPEYVLDSIKKDIKDRAEILLSKNFISQTFIKFLEKKYNMKIKKMEVLSLYKSIREELKINILEDVKIYRKKHSCIRLKESFFNYIRNKYNIFIDKKLLNRFMY
jgi:hypothetical protein